MTLLFARQCPLKEDIMLAVIAMMLCYANLEKSYDVFSMADPTFIPGIPDSKSRHISSQHKKKRSKQLKTNTERDVKLQRLVNPTRNLEKKIIR